MVGPPTRGCVMVRERLCEVPMRLAYQDLLGCMGEGGEAVGGLVYFQQCKQGLIARLMGAVSLQLML